MQIPFQIDSADFCSTLPSNHLSSLPWAKLLPTESVILPYANPPIKPIGQTTLTASNGSSTCYLTFQVIDMDQPTLLSTEAGKTLGVLTNARQPTFHCLQHLTLEIVQTAAGTALAPSNTSKRAWPKLGFLTMDK